MSYKPLNINAFSVSELQVDVDDERKYSNDPSQTDTTKNIMIGVVIGVIGVIGVGFIVHKTKKKA